MLSVTDLINTPVVISWSGNNGNAAGWTDGVKHQTRMAESRAIRMCSRKGSFGYNRGIFWEFEMLSGALTAFSAHSSLLKCYFNELDIHNGYGVSMRSPSKWPLKYALIGVAAIFHVYLSWPVVGCLLIFTLFVFNRSIVSGPARTLWVFLDTILPILTRLSRLVSIVPIFTMSKLH